MHKSAHFWWDLRNSYRFSSHLFLYWYRISSLQIYIIITIQIYFPNPYIYSIPSKSPKFHFYPSVYPTFPLIFHFYPSIYPFYPLIWCVQINPPLHIYLCIFKNKIVQYKAIKAVNKFKSTYNKSKTGAIERFPENTLSSFSTGNASVLSMKRSVLLNEASVKSIEASVLLIKPSVAPTETKMCLIEALVAPANVDLCSLKLQLHSSKRSLHPLNLKWTSLKVQCSSMKLPLHPFKDMLAHRSFNELHRRFGEVY